MSHTRALCAAALGLLILLPCVRAQTPAPSRAKKAAPARETAGRGAAPDPLAETRRATAIGLVTALAEEARSFQDEALRARVQARAADALWETDQEKARALFRRAWDAAEVSDRESLRRFEEERERQRQGGGGVALMRPRDLRSEVLRLAARRDRALGEEFLAKLDEARKRDAAGAPPTASAPQSAINPNAPENLNSLLRQRLGLARQLLQGGDVERALQFAAPALAGVTTEGLSFLSTLREQNAAEADKLYLSMLQRAAASPSSDANTVSLLSAYLFTPHTYVQIERGGGFGVQQSDDRARPIAEIPAPLRDAFFQAAAQILLRPLPPPDQDRSTAGREGTYFIIARLLPLFERYAPDKVPLLRTQLAALTPDVPESVRSGRDELMSVGFKSEQEEPAELPQGWTDRLNRATSAAERDRLYVEAAFRLARKDPQRAREYAEKVGDAETRRRLLAYLDYTSLADAVQKKNVEEALRLTKNGELTGLQRVWGYTEVARLVAKGDRNRAVELLDEATEEVRRIDADSPERAHALMAVLTPLFELDRARVWSLMPEVVKTVNAAKDYSGEDGRLTTTFRTREMTSVQSNDVPNFNLEPIFTALAKEDLDRAVELARSLAGEGPRAVATLAVANAALKEPARAKAKS